MSGGFGVVVIFGVLLVFGLFALLLALTWLRSARVLTRVVLVFCWCLIGVAVITAGWSSFGSLVGDQTTVVVALEPHVPQVKLPGLEIMQPDARILAGGADQATLQLQGLSLTAKLLLAGASVVQSAVLVLIALIGIRLARNVRSGRPFAGLSRPLLVAAYVLLIGTAISAVLYSTGSYLAGQESLFLDGWSYAGDLDQLLGSDSSSDLSYFGWPQPAAWSLLISPWPIGGALLLGLMGAVFRVGDQLQQDTEGLV